MSQNIEIQNKTSNEISNEISNETGNEIKNTGLDISSTITLPVDFKDKQKTKNESVIEEYFERGESLTGIKYERGAIFSNGSKKIDCSGLPIFFGSKKGYWDAIKKRAYTNSYKLFMMGKKRKSYFDIRRGDTIFFLPLTGSIGYHIGFAYTGVANNKLPLFDFYKNKHLGKISVRDLYLYRCGRSYCMSDGGTKVWRILNRTNIFEEQEKLLYLKK